MSRRTLPQRRECDTLIMSHGGQKHYCSWSRHSEGHLAEIFIAAGKTGSAYEAIARDLAVAASRVRIGSPWGFAVMWSLLNTFLTTIHMEQSSHD